MLAVHADAGDWVLPGQPLLDLDPTDYRLDADRARRALDLELAKADLTGHAAGKHRPFDPERVPSGPPGHAGAGERQAGLGPGGEDGQHCPTGSGPPP